MGRAPVDWKRCEALAARGADGDARALQELVEALWPAWMGLVRGSRAMASLSRSEDDVHDVLLKLVEKIDRGGRTLGHYPPWREQHPDKTFEDWMGIVVANAIRDHLRERLGPTRAPDSPDDPSVKRLFNEFACSPALEQLGLRPPITAAQTARQLLEFARARLPTDQCDALLRWIDGATFAEIEEELGLEDPGGGRKLVRAAIAVLRRHFAGGATAGA
jgi:DNA-directed RNA polymerase specialized sigma24 family protein